MRMKKNLTLMTCLLLLLGVSNAHAAFTEPQEGKVYRIHNNKSNKVISEDCIAREVLSVDAVAEDFKQLWVLQAQGTGFLVQNAYSGQYLQPCPQQSTQIYPTGTTKSTMYIKKTGTGYSIGESTGCYLHLDGSNNIVRWWDNANEASQWKFEEVNVSADAIALSQAAFQAFYAEYEAKLELMNHIAEYNEALPTFFTDLLCTTLQPAYADMSDEELRAAMENLPVVLQDIAVKVKNKAWGHREEEFRVQSFKAYSDPDYWAEKLYTKKYGRLNNPTGIYGKAGDVLYIFVGNDIPAGATLKAELVSGTSIQGEQKALKKGLNMVPVKKDFANLFIQYIGETSLNSDVLITDYPELKIHIEQGVVNGYWDKARHTDADWVDMKTNLFTGDVVQVKGDRIMFHMSREYITACCSKTITDAIGWWDEMTVWQQDVMGIEEVYPSKFNNLNCAISLTSGYQSATHYRTQYAETYIENLLPYERMMSNADNCWGPAHENGHVHQAAIQSVGTSEVSNNFFSNLTLYKLGRYTSRGDANSTIFTDYGAHKPYILRGGSSTMRSFWQLYLYFHVAMGDEDFYPRVFKAMRATPMKARDPKYYASYVNGNEDLLLFAKACCDAAQMDLSEFFRFWGYLEITDKQYIDDYAAYYLTNRQSDVDEFLAHAAQYPKAPSIVFIEDRVKAEARTDGGQGNKQHHGNAVQVGTSAGDVGHYTEFRDTTVKAVGYLYSKAGNKITIEGGKGAVGFKVYDKVDNTLLYGSNRLAFTLPEEVAAKEVVIVAAQANGTDVVVKTAAEAGTEEQQYKALSTAIKQAKAVIAMSDPEGKKPGYYFGSVVEDLDILLGEAQNAYSKKDQSVHTYGEWAMLLDEEMRRIAALSDAKQVIYAANWYSLHNVSYTSYSMINANNKLRCTIADPANNESKQWAFEPAGAEGVWYIRNKETGKYISSIGTSSQAVANATATTSALAFTMTDNGDGTFSFRDATQSHGALHCDASKNVVGWEASNKASHWKLTCIVDGQGEIFAEQWEVLMNRAVEILSELIVDYEVLLADDLVLCSDVTSFVGVDTLLAWATELQAYVWYDNSVDCRFIHCYDNPQKEIDRVTELIENLSVSYRKAVYMPEVSTDETLILYRIQNIENGYCLHEEKDNSRYLGYLNADEYDGAEDMSMLWYFLPGDADDTFYFYNYATRQGVYTVSGKTYITVLANGTMAEPYKLTADAEGLGFSVSTADGKNWYLNSMNYVQVSKTKEALWKFVKVGSVASVEHDVMAPNVNDAPMYDLQGRKVAHPTRGVYIQEGRKIVVE